MKRTPGRASPDIYFGMVKRFPLRPIRTKAEHSTALRIVREHLRAGDALDAGAGDYLETLAGLIERYERARFPIGRSSPLEIVRFLMEERDMRPVDLGRVLGSTTSATMILNGERELSKAHIRKLADHFKISAALFL